MNLTRLVAVVTIEIQRPPLHQSIKFLHRISLLHRTRKGNGRPKACHSVARSTQGIYTEVGKVSKLAKEGEEGKI